MSAWDGIGETCGCGASVRTVSNSVAAQWRREHRCSLPVPPGPCEWRCPSPVAACSLLAGHAGMHVSETDVSTGLPRVTWGTARWQAGSETTRPAHHHPAASTEESTK